MRDFSSFAFSYTKLPRVLPTQVYVRNTWKGLEQFQDCAPQDNYHYGS